MGHLGHSFDRYVFFLFVLVSSLGVAKNDDDCGETVANTLWLPGTQSAQPVLIGRSPNPAILAVAAQSETQTQLAHLKFIADLYGQYKSDFEDALVAGPAGNREAFATQTADQRLRATIAALIQKESKLGEPENKLVSQYFCAHLDDMTGKRLRALLNTLILQIYMTRFDEALFSHLALHQKGAELEKADFSEATTHASQTLFDLPIHLRFLADMHRLVPMTVLSVQENDNGRIEEAYERASSLEIQAAFEKASALALSPNVPDALSHFIRGQLALRQALPKLPNHPILIEWVRQTEDHLR